MPVEIYCPYENKRKQKRIGIAQLSLSSLQGNNTFHVNRNHQDNQLNCSGATQAATSSDRNIPNNLSTTAATIASVSPNESDFAFKSTTRKFAPSRSIPIRQRRRKKEAKEKNKNCGVTIQGKRCEHLNDNDYSKNENCNAIEYSLPQANFTGIHTKLEEPASLKITIGTAAKNKVAASTNGHGVKRKADVHMLDMKEICSVAFFKATPLGEFRRKCKDCLKSNALKSSRAAIHPPNTLNSIGSNCNENDNSYEILRYDSSEIVRRLTNEIDWKSLCEYHDKCEYRQQRTITNKATKSALSEIVANMINPMVIPRCCHSRCLIDVLLSALLISPSLSSSLQRRWTMNQQQDASTSTATATIIGSRWTPSQQLLLETIRRLLSSEIMPSNSSVTNYVRNFVVSRPSFLTKGAVAIERGATVTNNTTMTANKVNRLLSAIYWLLSSSLSLPSFSLSFEKELISSGLLLLQRIDSWDIQIDTESKNQHINVTSRSYCAACNEGISYAHKNRLCHPTNRNTMAGALSNLYDEAVNFENNTVQNLRRNKEILRRGFGHNQELMSLKNVLAMKQNKKSSKNNSGTVKRCRCIENGSGRNVKRIKVGGIGTIMLSDDWSTVRSRAYKKLAMYAIERRQQQHLRKLSPNDIIASIRIKSMPILQNSDEGFLWLLVNGASVCQESSSRRVCLALVAHSLGGQNNPCYFKDIAYLMWQGYVQSCQQQKSLSSWWLRIYSEWLSECSAFDQRTIAWEVMQPIVQHVTLCIISNQQDQRKGCASVAQKSPLIATMNEIDVPSKHCNIHNGKRDVDPSLMACLAYVLHRRSHLFRSLRVDEEDTPRYDNGSTPQSNIENDFQSFIKLVSIYCGESSEPWLSLFLDSTRVLVESTMQRLGVLSFPVSDLRKEFSTSASTKSILNIPQNSRNISVHSIATSNWPFSEEFSLRKAMGRIDQAVMSLENGIDAVKSLFTCPTVGCEAVNRNAKKRSSKTLLPSAPISDYLHESGILYLIFSFCREKEVAKIPQVCKAWKVVSDAVSNTLWKNAYVATFGKLCWPRSGAEYRHLTATSAISSVDFNDSCKQTGKISKKYWKNLYRQKYIAEKLVRFQRNPRSGYKHRICNYVGCLQILKTAEQERRHDQMHRRLLAKQQVALGKKKTSKKRKVGNRK